MAPPPGTTGSDEGLSPLGGFCHPPGQPFPSATMSSSGADLNGPTTECEFDNRLSELIRAAHDNGIEVEGGWAVRSVPDDKPDWGIEIYVVETGPPA